MATTSLVVREYQAVEIPQRREDGYLNASAMCRACGKRWENYWRTQDAREFAATLAADLGVPVDGQVLGSEYLPIIQVFQGGSLETRGVWVHPDLAVHLAMWLDKRFAVQVARWTRELLTTGHVALPSAGPTLRPYTDRIISCWTNQSRVPEGHWSVFEASSDLLILAESVYLEAGLEMDKLDLLDGSVGTHWSRFREGQPWAVSRIRYPHAFPDDDPRGTQFPWAYHLEELPRFWCWLRTTYMPIHFPAYLSAKYGLTAVRRALPVFQRRGVFLALNDHN